MRDVGPRFPDPYGDGVDLARTDYIPVHVGGVQVGWKHPDTRVYTPAVRCDPPGLRYYHRKTPDIERFRCDPPGQPISSLPKPLDRGHWGDQ